MATFDYTKLRKLEQRERRSPELMNIGDDFFEEALQHIRQLESRLEEERSQNPSSKKVMLISDELRNAKRSLEKIYESRQKKVVFAAVGSHTPKHLTRQERRFYDRLVSLLRDNRRRILEGDSENEEPPGPSSTAESENDTAAAPQPEQTRETGPPEAREPSDIEESGEQAVEQDVTLRMLQDMPSFVGSDMNNYELEKEDVVVLPKKTADILVERGAAEQVRVDWPT
jgi:DNA replication initiation complex subunit (GINS family)